MITFYKYKTKNKGKKILLDNFRLDSNWNSILNKLNELMLLMMRELCSLNLKLR